ncbi:AAA family ATPase [Streptomyces sp. DSM 41972]|uniref:DNA 3'-5' helicase n=1 Tax=Streptomyces althioticus subsp. attaecolombicae TaxID=3075534 RepID=A0ABU3HXS8_9ACTN|nr:AAA family ATPase [Streptomyces sp. DSM 41972]SCD64589.1 UvrD-like helicase C-terminal domain-containing protein [Streptomyces sp. di50b]SCD70543.1 UvrD-like helicase C-terminal domain-containing protein [Streptomyces sp. di188]
MSGAKVIMADVFAKSYDALDGSVQPLVLQFIMKMQRDPDSNGLNLKPPKGAKDKRVRTARVTDNYRAVLMHYADRIYYLVAVLPHDDAYDFAANILFDINKVTGGIELINLGSLYGTLSGQKKSADSTADTKPALFEGVSDADFERLGVHSSIVPALREIHSEDAVLGIVETLPKLARDVILCLADGMSVEEVWEQVSSLAATEDEVDPQDYEAAIERPATKEAFVITGDIAEFGRILTEPLSAWRIFLHPAQRNLAERKTPYKGPARVTGGPGTGKTVVALHRVKALAERLPPGQAILLTTFTTNLANLLKSQLKDLGGAQLLAKVDVRNIDKVAYGTVKETFGPEAPSRLKDSDVLNRWIELAQEQVEPHFDGRFLDAEWKQVVLAQDIRSRDEYFAARRAGRGRRLNRPERAQVWSLIEEFERKLDREKAAGVIQLAAQAARIASGWSDEERPYRHIIVDEAQDLHAAHWKLLRALVPEGDDDLFIVGDAHQRIYDNRTSLSAHGINIRGRSRRLTLNYRTTRQILAASLNLLGNTDFDDLDGNPEQLRGYRSVLSGAIPETQGYRTPGAEMKALAQRVDGWQREGIKPHEIAVVARTHAIADAALQALRDAGLAAVKVEDSRVPEPDHGVQVMTMHRIKGLEYRAVAVVGAGAQNMPLPTALTPEAEDRLQYAADLRREQSLLFVSATRAREILSITWSGRPSFFVGPTSVR